MNSIRTCYNIYLVTKNPNNRNTAKGILTQILHLIFQRLDTLKGTKHAMSRDTDTSTSDNKQQSQPSQPQPQSQRPPPPPPPQQQQQQQQQQQGNDLLFSLIFSFWLKCIICTCSHMCEYVLEYD
jgi:hypothetical protein